ncbi:MAG: nucleotidyltransferase family protein [Vicinamibacterales bacterium]
MNGTDVMSATLAAIVRGAAVVPPDDAADFLEAASHHGLRALVAERLGSDLERWPATARAQLGRELALDSALEALRERELENVLKLLAARGVAALLLKGSALAYTLYVRPEHRPRFDTDLLVSRDDMDVVADVMLGRGYVRPGQVTGELVMHQLDYARQDSQGVWHVYDFHWKLANRQVVAGMLSREELTRESIPIDALGPHARGLGHVHALMLACVHRVAHHPSEERLIWIYDIHLLTEALSPAEAESCAMLSVERSVRALCVDGLAAAQRWFGTRVPAALLALAVNQPSAAAEPSAAFLDRGGGRALELMSDLRALPEWSRRLRLLYEHAFPSPSYMRGMYMNANRAFLPALYTHRIVRGAWRLLRGGPR